MRRALMLTAVAGALMVVGTPASAAVRQVSVGNFYYDDETPGDGTVEAQAGDQLRFVVLDNGPGTPHTVEIDEFGVHSGSLSSGQTFTTPVLDRPGTYRIYCKPHDQRGHVATLVVRASSTATTTATTAAPAVATTGAAPATTATTVPAKAGASATTTTTRPAVGSSGSATPPPTTQGTPTTAAGSPTTQAVGDPAPGAETTETTLAPVGRGEATGEEIADQAARPSPFESVLGRRPAQRGPWTRSVRMAIALLFPMALIAAGVAARSS